MDYSYLVFPEQMMNYISYGGMLMLSAIIIIAFILLMRYAAKIVPAFMALMVYLLVGYVGTELLVPVIVILPGINSLLSTSVIAFCALRAVIMALMLQATRIIVIRFYNRVGNIELGNAMMSGLGVATGQAILSGMILMNWWVIGTNVNTYGANKLIEGMSVDTAKDYIEMIEGVLTTRTDISFLLMGVSNTIDIIFQVAVCVIIYAVIKNTISSRWYIVVVVLNAILSFTTHLDEYAVVDSLYVLLLIKAVVLIVVVVLALKLDKERLNGELRSFSKLKKSGPMPKFNNIKNK